MAETLLVELLTEELPPKALKRLGEAFAESVATGLRKRDFLTAGSIITSYATPRRLGVKITQVSEMSTDSSIERKLPPVSVAVDAAGKPTPVLTKALASYGLDFVQLHELERRLDGKTERFFYRQLLPGTPLIGSLDFVLEEAIESLPIPKVMRYQTEEGDAVQFVRPAHALVALHGVNVLNAKALGIVAGRVTQGHRFQGKVDITLAHASEYEAKLRDEGKVIVSFAERREEIKRQLTDKARELGAILREHDDLLDEVTALVEYPTVYAGEFEQEFLEIPQECLVLTMQLNQKYFPLFDAQNKLTNKFLIVSNMELADPSNIIRGNQRVVRPRLADARFFFEQDKKVRLEARVEQLANIVYHGKLGSQYERAGRVARLAASIAESLNVDARLAERAALLAKADLLTNMVGEFPELQGVMGRYYALHDGERAQVADAIEAHYRPRFAGDTLPKEALSCTVAVADKLEALAGMFGVGQVPTGDRDPFGLRRAALGLIRILVEVGLPPLNLAQLIATAFDQFKDRTEVSDASAELREFIYDRLRGYLRDQAYTANEIESVVSQQPVRLDLVPLRLAAVKSFKSLPEADSLAIANKRIKNILKKSGHADRVDPALFVEEAEKDLHAAIGAIEPKVQAFLEAKDYTAALKSLAGMKVPVDTFFDKVLVNAEDVAVRSNRLALLTRLERLMNQVADISKLSSGIETGAKQTSQDTATQA
jgi:glycyl-tRNA synthetase beta chain